MSQFLHETGTTRHQCALVVKKNLANALSNPRAVYGANLYVEEVLAAPS